jgi:hypothetical protein
MTVSSTTTKASYSGNGSTTVFAVPFYFLLNADLLVILRSSAGVETTQVLGTNYTVTGAGNENGGSLTMTVAPATGTTLTILRNAAATQETDLLPNDRLPAESLETALDKLTMLVQQLDEESARSLKVALTDSTAGTTLPTSSSRANKFLSFDNNGNPIVVGATDTYTVSVEVKTATQGQTVFTLTTMSYIPGINNLSVFVDGVNQVNGTAYTETSPTTVTFSQGLHAGAIVKFSTVRTLTSGESGSDAIQFLQSGTGAQARSVQNKLRDVVSVKDFGATGDGVTDDTAAIQAAFATGRKVVYMPKGVYKITSTITVPAYYSLIGDGHTSENAVNDRAATVILKSFNGVGLIVLSDTLVTALQVEGAPGNTGDGIQVKGGRSVLREVTVNKQGGNGIRIGADNDNTINVNLWRLDSIISIYNGGHGLYIHHSNSNTSGSYPQGLPDVNAGTATHLDLRRNSGDGLRQRNAIDNKFYGVVSQNNTGYGVRYEADARGHNIYGLYTESNVAGELLYAAGANDNITIGNRAVTNLSGWVDQGTRNFWIETNNSIPDAYTFGKKIAITNAAASGEAAVDLYADTGFGKVASFIGKQSTGTGGKAIIRTKRNGDTQVDRVSIDHVGLLVVENTTGGVLIGKTTADTTTAGIQIGDSGSGTNTRVNMVGSGSSSDTKIAFYNSNGQVGTIVTNGTATAYNIASDYRLKENAAPVDGAAALDAVMSWPIKTFTWKVNGQSDVGVIAHELQSVKPSAVSGEKDAIKDGEIDPQGVDYSKLVPELVAAVQHLAKQVADLKRNIQE